MTLKIIKSEAVNQQMTTFSTEVFRMP